MRFNLKRSDSEEASLNIACGYNCEEKAMR